MVVDDIIYLFISLSLNYILFHRRLTPYIISGIQINQPQVMKKLFYIQVHVYRMYVEYIKFINAFVILWVAERKVKIMSMEII